MSDAGEATAGRPVGRPGRPPRTSGGLIGSMIVCLVVIGAFVAFRALTRDNAEVTPDAVAYRETVGEIQGAGLSVAYPSTLPTGWKATSVDFTPGSRPDFQLGILTDDSTFVGLRQVDDSLDDLLQIGDDEAPSEGDPVEVQGPVGPSWRSWEFDDGDRAFTTDLGEDTVLVYGSASEQDQVELLGLLTTDPA